MKKSKFSRRDFIRITGAGAAAIGAIPARAAAAEKKKAGPVSGSGGCCITQSGDFYNVERGDPLPCKLPLEKQREIGMVRETWQLEVVADPASNSKIERPLLRSMTISLALCSIRKCPRKAPKT